MTIWRLVLRQHRLTLTSILPLHRVAHKNDDEHSARFSVTVFLVMRAFVVSFSNSVCCFPTWRLF